MVTTSRPWTAPTAITHERAAWPAMWTVQAPHWATPQPNLVPVSRSSSRSTQSRGVSSSTSTVRDVPFTRSVTMSISLPGRVLQTTLRRDRDLVKRGVDELLLVLGDQGTDRGDELGRHLHQRLAFPVRGRL